MITEYEIHPFANKVAFPSSIEQEALTDSIMRNGQREPILLYRGKIIDGRCRYISCKELDIEPIVKHTDPTMPDSELYKLVKDYSTRRSLSDTQKAVYAMQENKEFKAAVKLVAFQWGVGETIVKGAIYIDKYRPEYIQTLFDGSKVSLRNPKTNAIFETDKIYVIQKNIKEWLEIDVQEKKQPNYEWNPESAILTEKGKAWFAEQLSKVEEDKSWISRNFVELANFKFSL